MSSTSIRRSGLSDCGCCDGQEARTPIELYNRPGLSAIAYRTGTYNDFRASMHAHLSSSGYTALAGLRTRDDDDFSIALLDAWAVVSDVLSFYQERFVNESYLRTATERLSILEQARLIGYELSPGLAASTYLAFTMDDPPGVPDKAVKQIILEPGIKVQSTPGPDEDPQLYETVEEIDARVEWNQILPRLYQPQEIKSDIESVILQGIDADIKQGDLLFVNVGSYHVKLVKQVLTDKDSDTTRLNLVDTPELSPSSYTVNCTAGSANSMDDLITAVDAAGSALTDAVGVIKSGCWKTEDVAALAEMKDWDLDTIQDTVNTLVAVDDSSFNGTVFSFRKQAAVFGHNAPKWNSLPGNLRYTERIKDYNSDGTFTYRYLSPAYPTNWENATLEADSESARYIYLDRDYSEIIDGSYIVMEASGSYAVYPVTDNIELTRNDYSLSAKVSRLTVSTTSAFNSTYKIRTTSIHAQSEQLSLAQVAIEDMVESDTLTLDGAYLYLRAEQNIILTGERTDLEGITESEVVTLKEVFLEDGFTVLVFKNELKHTYLRDTVTINANVAQATHGETVNELLGSGDASQANQKFVLKQVPLTYVGADTPSGVKSTLEIRVDGILWNDVSSLYARDPDEHIYTTRLDDDGKVTVQFGDGINGARLTSGQNNVRATYRKGIGLGGLVKAKQLDLLMTRPLGLKSAINPLAPDGADDQEQLADARDNAPLTVLTLDRAVSLQDYEDFSRAFAGIAKSRASVHWDGNRKLILITIAGPKGATVATESKLYEDLSNALLGAGDPLVDFELISYRSAPFRINGNIIVGPAYVDDEVLAAVKSKLRETFSFANRRFGQPVMLSEVIAVIQGVAGVTAVDIDKLYRTDETETIPPNTRLNAALPEKDSTTEEWLGNELLVLDAAPMTDLGVKS